MADGGGAEANGHAAVLVLFGIPHLTAGSLPGPKGCAQQCDVASLSAFAWEGSGRGCSVPWGPSNKFHWS